MTFAIRQIELIFTSPNDTPLVLKNLKCNAVITNPGGNNAFGQCQLQVFGMTLAQMNQYSSSGSKMVLVQNQSVTVIAGNQGGAISLKTEFLTAYSVRRRRSPAVEVLPA